MMSEMFYKQYINKAVLAVTTVLTTRRSDNAAQGGNRTRTGDDPSGF